jgi:hypothetical protein
MVIQINEGRRTVSLLTPIPLLLAHGLRIPKLKPGREKFGSGLAPKR